MISSVTLASRICVLFSGRGAYAAFNNDSMSASKYRSIFSPKVYRDGFGKSARNECHNLYASVLLSRIGRPDPLSVGGGANNCLFYETTLES